MNADLTKTYYLTVDGNKHQYWHDPGGKNPKNGPIVIPQGTSTINVDLISADCTIHSWEVSNNPPAGCFTAPQFTPDSRSIAIINKNQNPNPEPVDYHVTLNVKTTTGEIIKCDPEVEDEGTIGPN